MADETNASLLRLMARFEQALTQTEAALALATQRAELAEAQLAAAKAEPR